MAPKSVTFRRHDHLLSVLFGDLLSHSYNITFSMFLDLVITIIACMCAATSIVVFLKLYSIILYETTHASIQKPWKMALTTFLHAYGKCMP